MEVISCTIQNEFKIITLIKYFYLFRFQFCVTSIISLNLQQSISFQIHAELLIYAFDS